jgi:hypothetical protein
MWIYLMRMNGGINIKKIPFSNSKIVIYIVYEQ